MTIVDTDCVPQLVTDHVVADIVVSQDVDGRHVVQIYEWSSLEPKQGNTNRALAKLREDYPGIIMVHDAGHPGDRSYAYWKHQLDAGRVDFVYDDDRKNVI